MSEPFPISEISPLDQIRIAEAETTRTLIAAREASERVVAEARIQASALKKEAHDSGTDRGLIRLREIVSQAEAEARQILEQAHEEAELLKGKGQSKMEEAIRETVQIMLGLNGRTSNES